MCFVWITDSWLSRDSPLTLFHQDNDIEIFFLVKESTSNFEEIKVLSLLDSNIVQVILVPLQTMFVTESISKLK